MRSLRCAARRAAAASRASIWESELAEAAARKTVTHSAAQRPPLVMFIDGGASIAQPPARLAGKEAHHAILPRHRRPQGDPAGPGVGDGGWDHLQPQSD